MAVLRPSGISVLASFIVLNLLSVIAVILRFVGIQIRSKPTTHHDWLCLVSLVCCVGYSIDMLVGTVNGLYGVHIEEAMLYPAEMVITLKTFFASQFLWATGITAFRLSILLLYVQIFSARAFRWCAYGCGAIVALFWVGSLSTTLAFCQPINYNWNKTISGSCGDIEEAELGAAGINMILDIVIVLLPLPLVWKLKMPIRKKIGISVTFALGLIISAVNLARIFGVLNCPLEDFTFCTRDAAILTVAEMAIGVIVACVPTLGVLLPSRWENMRKARYQYQYPQSDKSGPIARTSFVHRHGRFGDKDSSQGGSSIQHLKSDLDKQHHGYSVSISQSEVATDRKVDDSVDDTSDSVWVRKDIRVTDGTSGSKSSSEV